MPTAHSSIVTDILVKHYGWGLSQSCEPEVYGHGRLVCPRTDEEFTPHEAWSIQTEREGGETGTDAPLRHYDPLRWQALKAVEFIETVPFDNSPTTTAECWSRLVSLARFCRREGVLS